MLHKIRALFKKKKKTARVWRCLSSPPREPQAGTRGGHCEEGSVQGCGHHLLLQAEAASFSVSLFSSFFFSSPNPACPVASTGASYESMDLSGFCG